MPSSPTTSLQIYNEPVSNIPPFTNINPALTRTSAVTKLHLKSTEAVSPPPEDGFHTNRRVFTPLTIADTVFRSINAAFACTSVDAAFPTVIVRAVALVPMFIAPASAPVPISIEPPVELTVIAPVPVMSTPAPSVYSSILSTFSVPTIAVSPPDGAIVSIPDPSTVNDASFVTSSS